MAIKASYSAPKAHHPSVGVMPSVGNLFAIPFQIVYHSSYLLKSIYLGDVEGKIDATLRLSTLPLNALSSLSSLATTFMQIQTILLQLGSKVLNFSISGNFLLAGNVIGLFLSAIEIIVESVSIKRQVEFLGKFHLNSIEKIDQFIAEKDPKKKKELLIKCCHNLCHTKGLPLSEQLKETLSSLEMHLLRSGQIDEQTLTLAKNALTEASELILETDGKTLRQKFTDISAEENEKIHSIAKARFPSASRFQLLFEKIPLKNDLLKIKSNKLARRVAPWCAKEISSKIKPLLEEMKSEDPMRKESAIKQIKDLLFTVNIQAKKYLYYHIVSLLIFVGSSIGMIALLASCPPLIPAVILGTIGTVSMASYILHIGTIEQKGWKFSVSDCIPHMVKKGYVKVAKFFTDYSKRKEPSIEESSLKKSYQLVNGLVGKPRSLSYYQ